MPNDQPSPIETQATLANWRTTPHSRWAFHHVREILPTADIPNDPDTVRPLERGPEIAFPGAEVRGEALDLDGFHRATDTDALVIVHRGLLIHESYRGGIGPRDPHIIFSISKSMLGLLCGILVDKGLLDVDADCTAYVPELAPTAFAGATVRQLLDMRTGIAFVEDYLLTEGPIIEYRKATGWNPLEPGQTCIGLHAFMQTLTGSSGPHGGIFDYKSPCTDLLGWIIERATGRRYADVFAEYLWAPLGAECHAYVAVDPFGAPRTAGGVCMTARDLARVGDMVARDGGGIVPKAWIDDIESAGDPDAWDNGSMAAEFPGQAMHYRAKWYTFRERGPVLMGLGIHGQNLFVDRRAGLVMVRQSSANAPIEISNDLATLEVFERVREKVAG